MPIVILLLGVALGPLTCGIKRAQRLDCMQIAHVPGVALASFANDHHGNYPDGKSSTEVFQRLLDQGYVTDPNIFYFDGLHVPGKTRATSQVLKPENVSWDVTSGLDEASSGALPVVFLSGYRITYHAGAAAVILDGPPRRTWSQWWNGAPKWEPFMAYSCLDNTAHSALADTNGTIPNFIPADFDAKGKTYTQLTP